MSGGRIRLDAASLGAAAGASFGAGALACPFLIGTGSVLGGIAGEGLYNGAKGLVDRIRGKKPVVKLIPQPKPIEIKVPKLLKKPPTVGKAGEV